MNRTTSITLLAILISFLAKSQKIEAETGTLTGTVIENSHAGFSGTGYVTGFDNANDAVQVKVDVSKAGLFEVFVGYSAPNGAKVNDIYVNGTYAGGMDFSANNSFVEGLFGKVFLNSGSNTIKIVKNWGYFEVDYFRVAATKQNDFRAFKESLNNPLATIESKTIYQFLSDIYGYRILSGQQSSSGGDTDLNYIESISGKYPAVKGFDLIEYSPSRVERGSTSNEAEKLVEWWGKGGIPTCAWHWNAPKDLHDVPGEEWWRGFYTYATDFNVTIAMNDPNSEEYSLILRDIDAIAIQLKKVQDANVPILWRPLHEAEGRWFWWGAKGPEPLKWLWKLMYDRLTNIHELNNLIWVWTGTGSGDALDWYPGDAYVDIIGADIYLENKNYSTSFAQFDKMVGLHEGTRIVTLSETGIIPDPDLLESQGAAWNWFCTWSGDFIRDGLHNETNHIIKVYQHDYVLTLDELPDFSTYEPTDYSNGKDTILSILAEKSKMIVYPNPFSNSVRFDFGQPLRLDQLTIMDIEGRLIMTYELVMTADYLDLSLSVLPTGIYFIQIQHSGGISVERVVKN